MTFGFTASLSADKGACVHAPNTSVVERMLEELLSTDTNKQTLSFYKYVIRETGQVTP